MADESEDLFNYLLADISVGGAYARSWPKVANYCKRVLGEGRWKILSMAHERYGVSDA